MLVWIGIVGIVLAVVAAVSAVAITWVTVWALLRMQSGQDSFMESQKARMAQEDQWLRELSGIFSEFSKSSRSDDERFLADWKAASGVLAKCEQELADNLAALLREVKVSKAFAQGATALVEQNVLAVDRLWQIVETIRRGPRTPTNIAPTDEQAAEREKGGDTEAQKFAIEAMLDLAKSRISGDGDGLM